MSQSDRILWHLQNIGPITPVDAIVLYGITRLRNRIYDLRKKGYAITCTVRAYQNRFGDTVNDCEYRLKTGDAES